MNNKLVYATFPLVSYPLLYLENSRFVIEPCLTQNVIINIFIFVTNKA